MVYPVFCCIIINNGENLENIFEDIKKCPVCNNETFKPAFRKNVNNNDYQFIVCTQCELLFINPQPSTEMLKKVYSAQYFEGRGYDSEVKKKYRLSIARKRIKPILRYFNNQSKGKSLLDVGCASGYFLKVAQDIGFNIQGVEISSYAANKANELFNINVFCGTLKDYEMEANFFDIITCWDLFEHLKDPADFLLKANQLLNDEGIIVIHIPVTDSLGYKMLRSKWKKINPLEHLFYFSEKNLNQLMSSHGFVLQNKKNVVARILNRLKDNSLFIYKKVSVSK